MSNGKAGPHQATHPRAARPGHDETFTITETELKAVAHRKLPDLNTDNLDVAMRQIEGTARSMGVRVQR